MKFTEVFVPGPHPTIEECHRVMADFERLRGAPRPTAINARAHAASTRPPARAAATTLPPDANEVFFTYVAEEMDREKCSRAEAIRRVVAKQPSLHAAYIQEHNKERITQETRDRQAAARARASRNG